MKKETGDTVRFEDVAVVRHQQKYLVRKPIPNLSESERQAKDELS